MNCLKQETSVCLIIQLQTNQTFQHEDKSELHSRGLVNPLKQCKVLANHYVKQELLLGAGGRQEKKKRIGRHDGR